MSYLCKEIGKNRLNQTILMLSYNKYPNEDAGAVRDYVFAKLLKRCGFNICLVGMGASTKFTVQKYNDIDYISFRNIGSNKIIKINNYSNYTKRLNLFLTEYYSGKLPSIIWVVNIPIKSLIWVKQFALKNKIQLIHDSVEWYSPIQFKLGIFSPIFLIKEFMNRFLIDENFKVIVISKFLNNYYSKKNVYTLRIPVIFDKKEIIMNKNTSQSKLVLLYAGTPGKKDYLYPIFKSLSLLPDKILNKLELRIIGIKYSELIKSFKLESEVSEKIKQSIKVLGRIPREEVLENLSKADFSILLRNQKLRYAKAGFPTKFVESLATGTPVISNTTSDLGDFMKDEENSIVVNKCDSVSVAKAIMEAYNLKFSKKKCTDMQESSRLTFEKYFDFLNFKEELKYFLES